MRHVVGERATDKTAASVSQMGRFETCTNWVWLMRRIDEKPDLMNTIAVNKSGLLYKSARKHLRKEKS
jgi:hypothetical protein